MVLYGELCNEFQIKLENGNCTDINGSSFLLAGGNVSPHFVCLGGKIILHILFDKFGKTSEYGIHEKFSLSECDDTPINIAILTENNS